MDRNETSENGQVTRPSAGSPMGEALLESAVDAIIAIRADGTIERANPAAAKLFGYAPHEFVGRNVSFLMPEPYRSEHDQYLHRYLATGRRRIIGIGREVLGERADGSTFPMHLSVGEFQARGERFFTGIVHDLSERKSSEAALHHAQKMEAIGQLTGGVAHDFNNLLTVIVGNLELLERYAADDLQRDLLNEAQEAADLGARLTERLLAFARRSPMESREVDLNMLCLGLTDLLQRTLGETITLSSSLSPVLWLTHTDPSQLESAVVNLAVNARDAMPKGGKLVIETANVVLGDAYAAQVPDLAPGEYVRLSVTDTGHGMPKEVRERAFEPFFTTKERGRGTGLGLSMVFGFASQSGGTVTVYSEVAKGTTVNLYLPKSAEPEAAHGAPESTLEGEFPSRGETVLVVEDDDRVRRLTVTRLRDLGYATLEAETARRALEMLDGGATVDLLFSDLVMPGGMSGHELCDEVRTRHPAVKRMLTSGYAEELVHGDKLASEGVTLLRKPYRLAALAEAVREVLDGNRPG